MKTFFSQRKHGLFLFSASFQSFYRDHCYFEPEPRLFSVALYTWSTNQRNLLQLEVRASRRCVYFLSFQKCESGSCAQCVWVCVWAVTASSRVCENNSPGQSEFLLKPICEFTRLIHCDLRADLLLSPSHSPLCRCQSLQIFWASLSRKSNSLQSVRLSLVLMLHEQYWY